MQDIALKTSREQWMIESGGEKESQGDPCWQRDMMQMTFTKNICIRLEYLKSYYCVRIICIR